MIYFITFMFRLFLIAAWQAVRYLLPNVTINGCVFHWTQAVWRHVQEYGLAVAYREQQTIHNFIRQLLALPFLPVAHIRPAFQAMEAKTMPDELRTLMEYVERQWLKNSVFKPEDWSVYRHTVRTNNDCEGI